LMISRTVSKRGIEVVHGRRLESLVGSVDGVVMLALVEVRTFIGGSDVLDARRV
jgi:hypothetical protein